MTSYKPYTILPSAPPEAAEEPRSVENPQVPYHLSVIKAKKQGLIDKKRCFRRNTRTTIKH